MKREFETALDKKRLDIKAERFAKEENRRNDSDSDREEGPQPSDSADQSKFSEEKKALWDALKVQQFRMNQGQKPVVQVQVAGHNLTCMNCKAYNCIVLLNDDSVKFLQEWFIPLMEATFRKLSEVQADATGQMFPSQLGDGAQPREDSQEDSQSSQTSTSFHFSQNDTPNVQDKLWWSPEQSEWKLSIQEHYLAEPFTFVVPVGTHSTEDQFQAEKRKQYLRAVDKWNTEDGSKRARIRPPVAVLSDDSLSTADTSDGSQPSEGNLAFL